MMPRRAKYLTRTRHEVYNCAKSCSVASIDLHFLPGFWRGTLDIGYVNVEHEKRSSILPLFHLTKDKKDLW